MDTLNTDCLLEIIKFLKLKDQISIQQVNTSLHEAVLTLWLIKYKHLHINFLETPLTNKEWLRFLSCIKDIVEVMQLRFLSKEKYEIFKRFTYEKVKNFRFTLSKPYFMDDNDIRGLTKLLPNLIAFSPHGKLTGLYMDEWPNLKEINLSFCLQLEMQNFQIILQNLKLEKLKLNIFPNNNQFEQMNLLDSKVEFLKYLELNTYELNYFLDKPLTSLKELIITNHYNPRQLFDVLLSVWSANQIFKLETANIDNILVNCLEMNMNVEQLTIVNDENPLPSNILSSLQQLTDLRKLRFKNCNFNNLDLANLLKSITQITEISFENCQFKLANIPLKVEEIIVNRLIKLRLNMYENRLIDNIDTLPVWRKMGEIISVSVDLIGSHQLFELTHTEGETLCYEPFYVLYR